MVAGVGGGYAKTAIGKTTTAAFLDAYKSSRLAVLARFATAFAGCSAKNITELASVADMGAVDRHSRIFQMLVDEYGDLEGKSYQAGSIGRILAQPTITTQALLDMLVQAKRHDAEDYEYEYCISRFVRQIELRKKVYQTYRANLTHGSGSHRSLRLYCVLSGLIGLEASEQRDVRLLNALLKLNDVLVAKSAAICDRIEQMMVYLGVRLELELCLCRGAEASVEF